MEKKKNFVKHCSCALFIDEAMEGSCSFESLLGTPCSFDRRDKHRSTEIVPLSLCNQDVTGHRSTLSFSGIEIERTLFCFVLVFFRDVKGSKFLSIVLSLVLDGDVTVIPIRAKFQRKSLITLKEEGNLLNPIGELARTFQNISISKPVSSFL